ncbi:MAG: hypothetical protein KatS3mg042_0950 [Rhodothermaceae bacterium]|nr:MAG: hypothetical protein KatS3mg042_0950 [Rhodothermaceae bacterium]
MKTRWLSFLLAALFLPALAQAQPDWSPDATYGQSMTVVALVHVDGGPSEDPADLLAGFAGGVSRGVASPVLVDGRYVFFLSLGGEVAGEALTFRAYDASTGTERPLCEGATFVPDASRGTLDDPFLFYTSDGVEPCALHWRVAPGLTNQMAVHAAAFIEGVRQQDPADRVAAFVGGEVRGVGVPFEAGGEQVYRLELYGVAEGEPVGFRAYDAATGVTYVMAEQVAFAAGTTEGTPGAPVTLSNAAVLPVELASFTAVPDGEAVVLAWRTASETNNAGFEVQHDAAGAWHTLAFVEGQGTTAEGHAYTHRVEGLAPGMHRFRLRQVDFDGRFAYSPEVSVTIDVPGAYEVSAAYPNPFRGATTLRVAVAKTQPVRVAVYDVLGREVAVLHRGPLTGGTTHTLRFEAGGLPAGVYVVRVQGEHVRADRTVVLLQ